jgi:hypothetical protein
MIINLCVWILLFGLGLSSCSGDGAKISLLGKKEFEQFTTYSPKLQEVVLERIAIQEKTLKLLSDALTDESRTTLKKESFKNLEQKIQRAKELLRLQEKSKKLQEKVAGLSLENKQNFDEWKGTRELPPTIMQQLEWLQNFEVNKAMQDILATFIEKFDANQREIYQQRVTDSESELSIPQKLNIVFEIYKKQEGGN